MKQSIISITVYLSTTPEKQWETFSQCNYFNLILFLIIWFTYIVSI